MMTLYSFNPKNLNFEDTGEFMVRYLTDVKNQNIDLDVDPDFKELHNSIQIQSLEFNKALAQIRGKAESKQLLHLDLNRDKKISTLRTQLKVGKNSDSSTIVEAYGKINTIMNAYKDLQSRNYPTETLGINNLVNELKSATNQPFATLLLLDGHIANLEEANAQFVAKFDARSTETISTETYNTRVLRKNILDTYIELTNYIVVIAKRRNNDYYNTLITAINYSRQYFSAIVSGYSSKGTPPSPTP